MSIQDSVEQKVDLAMDRFARNLRARRESIGLSRQELGFLSGVHMQLIYKYEVDGMCPHLNNAMRICIALNRSLDEMCEL